MLPLFTLGVLAATWPGMPGVEPETKWAVVSASVVLLFFVRVRWTVVHTGICILFAWCVLSTAWSPAPYSSIDGLLKMGCAFALFCVGHETRRLHAFYVAAAVGILFSIGLSVAQLTGFDGVQMPGLFNRPDGTFGNPNFFAETAALVIVATACENMWALTAVLAPALLLAQERGALVAVAVAAVLLSGRTLLLVGALVVIMLVLPEHRDFVDSASMAQRLAIWSATFTHLTFVGHGIGTFAGIEQTALPRALVEHAHNDILEAAFEIGIPGALLALALAVMVAVRAAFTERLVLVALAVEGVFGFPLHEPATVFMGALVAGHAARGWRVVRVREPLRAASFRAWLVDRTFCHQGRANPVRATPVST